MFQCAEGDTIYKYRYLIQQKAKIYRTKTQTKKINNNNKIKLF